ncbi:unnamed protein product, partial [Discosporangium mesarthrocarpum]
MARPYRRSASLRVSRPHSRTSAKSSGNGILDGPSMREAHATRKSRVPSERQSGSLTKLNDPPNCSPGVYYNDDDDIPPVLAKLGERPAQRKKASQKEVDPLRDHVPVSRNKQGNADCSSPEDGGDGPVPFKKMKKPIGWEGEQAVEIRRDWISYLAKHMGLDSTARSGVALENLVVRKMLERAEKECLGDFLDEWDTDDDEEERAREAARARSRPAGRTQAGQARQSHSIDHPRFRSRKEMDR